MDLVSMVISNCEFVHNPDITVMLHEENDKDKFVPDGVTIAYVKSNFCELYHKDYMYLDKKYMEQYAHKSNKGRKKLEKQSKRHKQNCGTGNEFGSSIAFGLIHEDRIYEMRVFRKTTIGVSGLKSDNIEFIKLLINKLIDYLNLTDPQLMIKMKNEPNITLCNLKYHFMLPNLQVEYKVSAFNLYKLMHLMSSKYGDNRYWYPYEIDTDIIGADVPIRVLFPYNGMSTFYFMNIKCENTCYYFKFYSNGKLNIYGGNNSKVCEILMRKFITILETHKDSLIQLSIPTGADDE